MSKSICELYRNFRNKGMVLLNNFFLFFPINNRKIVFDNFSGRGYGDNPKYIADELYNQGLNYDMVWITYEPSENFPDYIRPVRYGSLQAMFELSTSKFWVDNVRGTLRPKKKKGQIYIQTWHSSGGVKKLEGEIENILPKNYIKAAKKDGMICNAIVAASKSQYNKMHNYFWLGENTEILKFGSPRNDLLFDKKKQKQLSLKLQKKLNISADKGVILYMPTFRDDKSVNGYILDYEMIRRTFEKKFRKQFVIIVRFHPSIPNLSELVQYNNNIINVTNYSDSQELYAIADYLITDYSSAPFDFSILKKPVFLCALDKDKYIRGLSPVFYKLPFPIALTHEELLENILTFNESDYWRRHGTFMKEWESYDDGHATQRIIKWIESKC